ncbi:MAG: hypothetical protein ACK4WH_04940 [Phycisphaerales bacterium]
MVLRRVLRGGAGVGVLALASQAGATVLIFNPVPAPDSQVSQIYGDRVTSTNQFGFEYGAEFGFTPNVTVEYRPTLRYRETGHGDLVNFLYRENSGNQLLEINLNADDGYTVCLHYFDIAAQLGEALPVKSIDVFSGQLVSFFHEDYPVIPDIIEPRPLPPGQTGTPTHRRIEFDPIICNAPTIKIRIDLTNLGIKVPRIGIDNIAFSQHPIPTPGAGVLLGLAGLLAARRGRRTLMR